MQLALNYQPNREKADFSSVIKKDYIRRYTGAGVLLLVLGASFLPDIQNSLSPQNSHREINAVTSDPVCVNRARIALEKEQLVQGEGHLEVEGKLCPDAVLPLRINISRNLRLYLENYPEGLSDEVDFGDQGMGKTLHAILEKDGKDFAGGQVIESPKTIGRIQARQFQGSMNSKIKLVRYH